MSFIKNKTIFVLRTEIFGQQKNCKGKTTIEPLVRGYKTNFCVKIRLLYLFKMLKVDNSF